MKLQHVIWAGTFSYIVGYGQYLVLGIRTSGFKWLDIKMHY
jgi:hypothetical protein